MDEIAIYRSTDAKYGHLDDIFKNTVITESVIQIALLLPELKTVKSFIKLVQRPSKIFL